MKNVIQEEWEKVDKKGSLINRFNKMYPFKSEEMRSLETPPIVDAAVMRDPWVMDVVQSGHR